MNNYLQKYMKYKTKYINLLKMSGGNIIKINFSNRLERKYSTYPDDISMDITVKDFIKKIFKKVEKKNTREYDLFIDKHILFNKTINIKINNIDIKEFHHNLKLFSILTDKVSEVTILIEKIKERDIESYENMKALLIYLNQQPYTLNIISELSFNVQDIIEDGIDMVSIVNKNILQQTHYPNIDLVFNSMEHQIINIILYDMVFFENTSDEAHQIYELVNLHEVELDFPVTAPAKIKKFTKPKKTNFSPKYPGLFMSDIFTLKLNEVLSKYFDYEINWYIINFKLVTPEDNIKNILEDLDIINKNIYIYNFNGQRVI